MKTLHLFFSLILLFFAFLLRSQSPDNKINKNSSHLEKAWNELISSLKTGETQKVQAATTPKGFQCLTNLVSPTNDSINPFKLTFIGWGKAWGMSKVNYYAKSNTVELLDDKGKRISRFAFVKTKDGWRLDDWQH